MAEYIDKEVALSLIKPDRPEDKRNTVTIATAKKLVRSIVCRTPAADVASVVHGKWIHEETEGGFHIWKCSQCGRGMNDNPEGIDLYCYHCEVKMDEEEFAEPTENVLKKTI